MNIQYVGPSLDYSGYGEACRHDIGALLSAGFNITCRIPRYTHESTDYGPLGEIVKDLENKDLSYKVKIIHTTPDQFLKYKEDDKYNIGRVFWETDKIPPDFAENCELMDELWTGSEFNAQAIRNAGVTRPIYIIPEAIDANLDIQKIKPFKTKADETFSFYSIFEWTERKNPDALLRAFWSEFTEKDNVSLVIKTYLDSFSVGKRRDISQAIGAIKSALNLPYYAPVYLYRDLLLREQVYRFHRSFDCFVSTHRGEGWGIPQMEAMLCGNPVISSDIGGIHEYLTDQEDCLLLPVDMVQVQNTRNTQWYLPDQNWGNVKIQDARDAMRQMYEKPKDAKELGLRGQSSINEKFSLEAVGKLMTARIQELPIWTCCTWAVIQSSNMMN